MSDRLGTHVEAFGEEGLCDVRQVARYLKTSTSWVYKNAERDLLPCVRFGNLLRFERHIASP